MNSRTPSPKQPQGLDSRERIHLQWMFENQPDLVRQLHRSGKLRQHLDKKMQQALRRTDQLKAQAGMSENEAFEAATQEILSPANGLAFSDNPPEPLQYQEQRAIKHSL